MSKTYLQLTQDTARESGTVSGTLPTSVAGQSGRLLKFVKWVATAYEEIQNMEDTWRWLRTEFTGEITSGTARYTDASFSLTRWAEWITDENVDGLEGESALSIYKTATGASDEGPIREIPWNVFTSMYVRGSHDNVRPVHYAVSPMGELCFGPTPDATYTVRGEYVKGPQTLAENTDTPEMPGRFHDVIYHYALVLMAEHDEAPLHIASNMRRFRQLMDALRRDQLPQLYDASGPIA